MLQIGSASGKPGRTGGRVCKAFEFFANGSLESGTRDIKGVNRDRIDLAILAGASGRQKHSGPNAEADLIQVRHRCWGGLSIASTRRVEGSL